MSNKNSYTYPLSAAQQATLTGILAQGNYEPVHVPYASIAARTPECNVTLYQSGKCLVQGRGATDFVTFVLEPLVLQTAGLGYEEVLQPEAYQPHMGVDESGKGDYFGPLVVAAAYVDEELVKEMADLNVRDSKTISSDKQALALGRDLRRLLGKRFSLVKIGPRAYNRLYSRMLNVNTLLGWAHARAIENLLENVPDCPRAVSDQFGSKQQVSRALMKKGRKVELVQRPRAESDPAVAAASVIAREIFLRSLLDTARGFGIDLPKGASAAVCTAAEKLVAKHGPETLLDAAKCHFRTTDKVLEAGGLARDALGPEGQATSKPVTPRRRRTE